MKLYFLCLSLVTSQVLFSQSCKVENTSFAFGERVDYTIYYHLAGVWVGAGDVFFKVDSANFQNKPYYHFNSEGSTFKKYDWIYKVRDHYETFMNVDEMKPIRFKRKVNEGGTHIREDYIFNYSKQRAYTLRQMGEEEPFVKDTVVLNECSYDVMSMIYVARNLDYSNLNEGDKIPIQIFLDNESHDSYIEYLGIENLKIKNLGEFRCIKFSPLLIEGTIFNAGNGMTVYVTDDQNRVPMLIETPILVGSIKARVNKMSGLRFPLTSRIEED